MRYSLLKETIELLEKFESETAQNPHFSQDITGFKRWIKANFEDEIEDHLPEWEGREKGRSPESVINTLIVHMNRYAKSYAKAAIAGSGFASQEDFIYLINLKAFGSMSKMELIRKNVHDKPVGMQIINRLIGQGWVRQTPSEVDKRSRVVSITPEGEECLERQMGKIRQATTIVTGNLTQAEKMELIRLLSKLDDYHRPIYESNVELDQFLDYASGQQRLEQQTK